ncbi:tetratricopeptide repeat protein [Candidatus Acetothermia bacterium]|nr:tetratricopeptide repeat protein [Candidatus Acetothermia bacterium]
MAVNQGDYARARRFHESSLAIRREIGDKSGIAYSLEGLAKVACLQEQTERAARLFGEMKVLRESIGAPLPPSDRTDYERHLATVRASLSEGAFANAWAQGRAMTLEQAIDYALQKGCS